MKRVPNYIVTIPMKSIEQVIEVKKTLELIFGTLLLRGRHCNRQKVLGNNYRRGSQNDIPWHKAQLIDIYIHPKNPNYQSVNKGKGIKRMNLDGPKNIKWYGRSGLGLYDKYMIELQEKGKTIPYYKRKYDQYKYNDKTRKLLKGEWGYITQSLLDFVEQKGTATFTEMKTYYDVVLRGKPKMEIGGSFIHHLQAITKVKNAFNRRCKRLLVKDGSTKRYFVSKF